SKKSPRLGGGGAEQGAQKIEVCLEGSGRLVETAVPADDLPLDRVIEPRGPYRVGEPSSGQPPREAAALARGQSERARNEIRQVRNDGHGSIVFLGRAEKDSRAEQSVEASRAADRGSISIRADSDLAALPELAAAGG